MNLENIIRESLAEDIGEGDHTSMSTVPPEARGKMQLLIKQPGIIAGIEIAQKIVHFHDPNISIRLLKQDGDRLQSGDIVLILEGKIWSLLSVERVMLNFMQRMSGIATYTRSLVDLISDLPVKLLDTRKTTPQFRMIEKMAVAIGGGHNHRFGLFDMILIKDNHVDFSGGITSALSNAFDYLEDKKLKIPVEIEVRGLDELQDVLHYKKKVNRVMFDNFSPELMKKAVKMVNNQMETEASGMINEQTIRAYAETGVDFISMGALTHQVSSLDMSLKAM
ncbi:MAG: carboxylating nicotinate-nucleotide diphosphorylase [Candidatus Cloacimonetes bacterium]|nr:carboxylating nicotinate-nucleotide diphosphorylase [Candidatus Cloacimonadota bacterium]MDY0230567.1 carboxylating nicotinate-nucleotide diphosphorylase [Candidatus Cloacimonadaceae bacterium]